MIGLCVNPCIVFLIVPPPPGMFMLVATSSSSLTASWQFPDPPNGIITAYTVYCRTNESDIITTAEKENAEITGLDAFTTYECYVTANTSIGESSPSNSVVTTTNEDSKF